MDIEKYRTFITAAHCDSFAQAAEKLYLSTPTVTKHIKALEQEMGVALFERTPQGVLLTNPGRERVELARQMVESYDALQRMNTRQLKLYSIPCLEKIGVPGLLSGFNALHPEISVSLVERHGQVLTEDLLAGRCELAFLGTPYARMEEMDSIPLFSTRLCAALPENHPLAGCKSVSLAQLKDDGFIFMPMESGLYKYYESCCLSAGFTPNVKAVCSREDSILSYVSSGIGVAFYSFGGGKKHTARGIKFIKLKEDYPTGCILAKVKGRRLSGEASAFWKYMQAAVQQH